MAMAGSNISTLLYTWHNTVSQYNYCNDGTPFLLSQGLEIEKEHFHEDMDERFSTP